MLSVIFPAKNEEGSVEELHRRLKSALDGIGESYEIVAVDDGSWDGTVEKLKGLSPLRVIVLARNYGQSLALDAGVQAARGDTIATIDADLQNDPADIPLMVAKLYEGYDAVVGWREERRDPFGRRLLSSLANWLTRKITGLKLHDYACGLKVFKRRFIEDFHLYGEMHVFLAAILHLRGAKITEVVVRHRERSRGVSKHTILKAVKNLADLLTIKFLMSTSRPLVFFGGVGLASWLVGGVAAIWAVVLKIMDLRNFAQTPLPIVASLFIILGFFLVMMGFLAELMLRAYHEGSGKVVYKIRETIENK